MNHFSLTFPPSSSSSDTLWYTSTPMDPHQKPPSSPFPFFYHHPSSLSLSSSFKNDDVESDNSTSNIINTTIAVERSDTPTTTSSQSSTDQEYMFEKPLTPSDVGKLNRLVIPKQHAEKYFPLAGDSTTAAATSGGGGGGVLLGFEDESGKCWKFRYSYWNSSQSYVLTKGWSRYVKEKKLDAGDVVFFQRHRFESDRFFIGWRRRGSSSVHQHQQNRPVHQHNYGGSVQAVHGFNGAPQQHLISRRPDCLHAGTEVRQRGRKSGGGNSKSVRLFGVNLEYQIQEQEELIEEEEEMSQSLSDGSSLSSQGQGQIHAGGSGYGVGPTPYNYFDYMGYPPNHHYNSHMEINFPQDVNQMSTPSVPK